MEGSSADLQIVGLHYDATLFGPKLLQCQNEVLEIQALWIICGIHEFSGFERLANPLGKTNQARSTKQVFTGTKKAVDPPYPRAPIIARESNFARLKRWL